MLPEKKRYEPGEIARLQVRMPFREATALVAVEREGVIATQVVTLRGDDPTVELKVEPGWGPNVYVSVLALRGRIRETPWYSFFTWGWKAPVEWWRSFRGRRQATSRRRRRWSTSPSRRSSSASPSCRSGSPRTSCR